MKLGGTISSDPGRIHSIIEPRTFINTEILKTKSANAKQ
jgi:hypothetical protein